MEEATKMTDCAPIWDPFALLLIDVQRDFWTDEMSAAFPDYERHVSDLLTLCRQEKIDVVHLRARFREDQTDWMVKYRFLDRIPCIEGTPGAEIFPCAAAEAGEKVIIKQSYDGFQNPELQAYLSGKRKRFLLIAGLVTSVCVLFTAATAAQKGFLVGIVEDCCGDLPAAHDHTLQRYPFVFCRTKLAKINDNWPAWADQLNELGVHTHD